MSNANKISDEELRSKILVLAKLAADAQYESAASQLLEFQFLVKELKKLTQELRGE